MNHRNYFAYRMSKRKIIIVKNFNEVFKQLDYANAIIEEEKEIFFVTQNGEKILKMKYAGKWYVYVKDLDDAFEKWKMIKSHLGYIRPACFIDNNEKVVAYTHGCWLVY